MVYAKCQYHQEQEVVQMIQIIFAIYVVVQCQNETKFVENLYYVYFGINLGDQDKAWAPHKVSHSCVESLHRWSNGKQKSLEFGVWMVWRKPKAHGNECYFCSCNIAGFNGRNKHYIQYPNAVLFNRVYSIPKCIREQIWGIQLD